uniref:Uncharacterized protein n=1 Tax=Rhizophora mucronata TaxID=61149 RepID=A0A2P2KGI0_RHIMU
MADSDSNFHSRLRCHHCAGPLSKEMETSSWTVSPLIRDSLSMIGSAVGGTASAFYGFNHGTSCNSILFSLCRVDRWCCSGTGPAGIFFVPCSGLIPFITSFKG